MVLSVMLLSSMLLFTLNVIGLLIHGNRLSSELLSWKNSSVSFDQSNNSSVVDVKMNESILAEKLYFPIMGMSFSSALD